MHVSASFDVRKVIPGTSGGAESFSSGSGRGEAGGESAFCGRFAGPRPVILPRARRFGDGLAGPGDGRGPRDRFGRSGPGWVTGSFADRCSRGPGGVVEVVTAVVGAPAAPAARSAAALPDRPTPAGCPNLPQRPRPSRSAREETLIFRASAHSRHRPGAPLWQIWTRPAPGRHRNPTSTTPRPPIPLTTPARTHGPLFPARKAHYPGPAPARTPLTHSLPHHHVDPWLWAAGSGEIDLNASSAQQNPPQLARCELSSTKSTSARFVRAQLAQCELR